MKPDTKALKKLKRKHSKNPDDRGVALVKRLLLSYSPGWLVVWVLRKYFVKSDYKAARESIKFFQLSNRAYGTGKRLKAQRLLTIALRLLGDRLPKSYTSLLHSALAGTLKDSTTRNSNSNSILSATKDVPVEIFDASSWYQLSRGLFSLGYFRAAWVARGNSLDLSISESLKPDCSSTVLERGLQALFEREEYNKVRNILAQKQDREFNFDLILNLIYDSLRREDIDEKSKYAQGEKLLNELIANKVVALVGPGVQDGLYGSEIDSADTVFRVRFGGTEYLEQETVGSRCEIAQYNDISAIRELSSMSGDSEFFDSVKLIVVFADIPTSKLRNTQLVSVLLDLPVYRSTATSGLVNLVAVIKNSPAHLKVYGFDFYSRVEQYGSYVLDFYRVSGWKFGSTYSAIFRNGRLSSSVIAKSFSAHDPVSNFCFAQNLYKAGLFEIEPYGKSILELTPYQYVERLEEMLGDW